MSDAIREKLKDYLRVQRPNCADLEVGELKRYFGGSSKPTYRFELNWLDQGSRQHSRKSAAMVLRTTPERSLVDHSNDVEAQVLRLAHRSGVAVPEVYEIEPDRAAIGMPFFLMEEIPDCESQIHALMTEPYVSRRDSIGRDKWRMLGRIGRIVPTSEDVSLFAPTSPETSWWVELAKWETAYHRDAPEPEPLVDHAIRWLRRNPPPPASRITLVHGDFRTGNFLFDREGKVRAVLDWEMAHLGDPVEDVAWASMPSWGWGETDRPGRLIPREEAFAIWERETGLSIDRSALHWWSVLGTLKAMAIWSASARNVIAGSMAALDYCAAWYPYDVHLRGLADLLLPRKLS